MTIGSGSSYRSGYADESKARCLSVPTCLRLVFLLCLMATLQTLGSLHSVECLVT